MKLKSENTMLIVSNAGDRSITVLYASSSAEFEELKGDHLREIDYEERYKRQEQKMVSRIQPERNQIGDRGRKESQDNLSIYQSFIKEQPRLRQYRSFCLLRRGILLTTIPFKRKLAAHKRSQTSNFGSSSHYSVRKGGIKYVP